MSSLKRYNEATSQWEYVAIGKQGIIGPTGPTGPGLPTGGNEGQVISKASATDYDTEWVTVTVDPTPQIFLLMGA
jgi:hypothetical protein